jgi:hypothetical protein
VKGGRIWGCERVPTAHAHTPKSGYLPRKIPKSQTSSLEGSFEFFHSLSNLGLRTVDVKSSASAWQPWQEEIWGSKVCTAFSPMWQLAQVFSTIE